MPGESAPPVFEGPPSAAPIPVPVAEAPTPAQEAKPEKTPRQNAKEVWDSITGDKGIIATAVETGELEQSESQEILFQMKLANDNKLYDEKTGTYKVFESTGPDGTPVVKLDEQGKPIERDAREATRAIMKDLQALVAKGNLQAIAARDGMAPFVFVEVVQADQSVKEVPYKEWLASGEPASRRFLLRVPEEQPAPAAVAKVEAAPKEEGAVNIENLIAQTREELKLLKQLQSREILLDKDKDADVNERMLQALMRHYPELADNQDVAKLTPDQVLTIRTRNNLRFAGVVERYTIYANETGISVDEHNRRLGLVQAFELEMHRAQRENDAITARPDNVVDMNAITGELAPDFGEGGWLATTPQQEQFLRIHEEFKKNKAQLLADAEKAEGAYVHFGNMRIPKSTLSTIGSTSLFGLGLLLVTGLMAGVAEGK